ncbi:hypothetical protein BKA62DRAFT_758652 [Auriculariales sp. MPI-PUGE-AT-0066]|nr:hypothetical protein BKA62DRAFT_758652 [Auriculariales sp. MPI-PUGE-AT-0066]
MASTKSEPISSARRRRPSLSFLSSKHNLFKSPPATYKRLALFKHKAARNQHAQPASDVTMDDAENGAVLLSRRASRKESPKQRQSSHSSQLAPPPSPQKENLPPRRSPTPSGRRTSSSSSSSGKVTRVSRPTSRFRDNLTKLMSPPAGIPLALLNGSAQYLRALESPPGPRKRALDSVYEDTQPDLNFFDEEDCEIVNLPPKKRLKFAPPTPPGVTTRAQAARSELERRRITRSMSSQRSLGAKSLRASKGSPRKPVSTSSPHKTPPTSSPHKATISRSPRRRSLALTLPAITTSPSGSWSIVDAADHEFEFSASTSASGIVHVSMSMALDAGKSNARLAPMLEDDEGWTSRPYDSLSTTSLAQTALAASSAMSAFATVANLHRIVEDSAKSTFSRTGMGLWDDGMSDVDWQHVYADEDFVPMTPSNSIEPILAAFPVPPTTMHSPFGRFSSASPPPTGLPTPTWTPSSPVSGLPAAVIVDADVPDQVIPDSLRDDEEEVDITEMLPARSASSGLLLTTTTTPNAILKSGEAVARFNSPAPPTVLAASVHRPKSRPASPPPSPPSETSPNTSAMPRLRPVPRSLPHVQCPIRPRVPSTRVDMPARPRTPTPSSTASGRDILPTLPEVNTHDGFTTAPASIFKNLRKAAENKTIDIDGLPGAAVASVQGTAPCITTDLHIDAYVKIATRSSDGPPSPTRSFVGGTAPASLFTTSRLMGARSTSTPNRMQPIPLPLSLNLEQRHLRGTSADNLSEGSRMRTMSLPAASSVRNKLSDKTASPEALPLAAHKREPRKEEVQAPQDSGDIISQAAYARPQRARAKSRARPPHLALSPEPDTPKRLPVPTSPTNPVA